MPIDETQPQAKKPTKTERVFKRKNMTMEAWSKLVDKSETIPASDDDDILLVKRANHELDSDLEDQMINEETSTDLDSAKSKVAINQPSTKRKAQHTETKPIVKHIKTEHKPVPLSLEEQEEVALAILRKSNQ